MMAPWPGEMPWQGVEAEAGGQDLARLCPESQGKMFSIWEKDVSVEK